MYDSPLTRALKREMDRKGIGLNTLAREAGLHKDAVRNVFRGKSKNPRMRFFEAVSRALDVPEIGRASCRERVL